MVFISAKSRRLNPCAEVSMNPTIPPLRLTSAELFALSDDGQGNALGRFRRRLKFTVRLVWYRHHLHRLQQDFDGRGIGMLLRQQVRFFFKGTRPYLWHGLSARHRFQAQMHHFEWMVRRFSAPAVRSFYACGRRNLLALQRSGSTVSLHLQPAFSLAGEGELELHLCLDGQEVMRAESEVASNKRSQLRGRNALREQILQACRQSARDLK